MESDNSTKPELEGGSEPVFDFWSDEGARRFNQVLEEGSAYALARPGLVDAFAESCDDGECEYLDPDPDDSDEGTLPPGEMELIFENCFIM